MKMLNNGITKELVYCLHIPMLSPPCESVQICTDPDRYSRICRKLSSRQYCFENEIS